jgi:hypothetical protein
MSCSEILDGKVLVRSDIGPNGEIVVLTGKPFLPTKWTIAMTGFGD